METLKWMIRCVGGIRLFSKQHLPINLTGTSHLDFTGVIEEHNEVHHRQRLMELPVRNPHSIFSFLHWILVKWFGYDLQHPCHWLVLLLQTLNGLELDFDLDVQQQPPPVPQQRVNSVIKALPVPQQQHHHHHPAPQQHPEDRTKGDLIAEKLKLLASDRSEEGSTFNSKKDQEEQDLLSLLGEQQIMFPPQAVDNLSNYMSWEVKEEEVFPS